MKCVGIVGANICENTLKMYEDKYDLWGTNNLFEKFKNIRFAKWFEIHKITRKGGIYKRRGFDRYPIHSSQSVKTYLEKINSLDIPVYMQKSFKIIKNCKIFPYKKLIKIYGTYFGCSFALMTAFAIEQGVAEIAFFGTTLSGNEYYYQRPSTEHIIGIAKGRGIKIFNHSSSLLLTSSYTYGYNENFDLTYLLHGDFTAEICMNNLLFIQQRLDPTAEFENREI